MTVIVITAVVAFFSGAVLTWCYVTREELREALRDLRNIRRENPLALNRFGLFLQRLAGGHIKEEHDQ